MGERVALEEGRPATGYLLDVVGLVDDPYPILA